jgi:NADPH:quinone reductase-like Zn-dependent oxidoreductase
MKAIIWTKYGPPDVLKIREIEKPVPGINEILVKISACTVSSGDCEMRSLKFPFLLKFPLRLYIGFKKPKRIKILGQEFAGEIESVGKNVKTLKVGDKIFAATGFKMGAYAEYICFSEKPTEMEGVLAKYPDNITPAEAAAIPVGGLNALYFLRKGNITKGQKVLINGAGGSIGTIAVQLAKLYGAEVSCVDSTDKLKMLNSIGADHVIDYTKDDFSKNGKKYDLIFDIPCKGSFSACLRSLNENGVYLLSNPTPWLSILGKLVSLPGRRKVITGTALYKTEDLKYLIKLVDDGKIKSVIDKIYTMEQIADAHSYVERGDKKGNIVIFVEHD